MKCFLVAPLVAIFATGAIAANCQKGYDYCGRSLMKKGKYKQQIQQVLYDNGKGNWDGDDVLFHCMGGPNGAIKFKSACGGGCFDHGKNKNDSCK